MVAGGGDMKKLIAFLVLALGLTSCHTNRHLVQTSDTKADVVEHSNTELHAVSVDSLLSKLSFTADSVVVCVSPQDGDTVTPTIRITAHNPRVNSEARQTSAVDCSVQRSDTAISHTCTNTNINDTKEVVAIAEPPNLTWLFIVLAVLLIAAVVLLLWLHKKHII